MLHLTLILQELWLRLHANGLRQSLDFNSVLS
jgi:hypothetical protein